MLVLKLVIHPHGDTSQAREIGRMILVNSGPAGEEGLLPDWFRKEFRRRRDAGEPVNVIRDDLAAQLDNSAHYTGLLTDDQGLELKVLIPVHHRPDGPWALALAALLRAMGQDQTAAVQDALAWLQAQASAIMGTPTEENQ